MAPKHVNSCFFIVGKLQQKTEKQRRKILAIDFIGQQGKTDSEGMNRLVTNIIGKCMV